MCPNEDNIDTVLLATTSMSRLPDIDFRSETSAQQPINDLFNVIRTVYGNSASNELFADHYVGRCFIKAKSAQPDVTSVEDMATELCMHAESEKEKRGQLMVST